MSAIRIDTLPVLSAPYTRDLVNFQRLVDGVWTDYHTDFATIEGDIRTFQQPIDFSDTSSVTVYTPDTDELVVPLAMWVTYTPYATPSNGSISIQCMTSGVLGGLLDLTITQTGSTPGIYSAIDIGQIFTGLDASLELAWVSTGGNGTGIIFVQYMVLPKV